MFFRYGRVRMRRFHKLFAGSEGIVSLRSSFVWCTGMLVIASCWLAACTGQSTSVVPAATPTPAPQALGSLHWCHQKVSMVFTDDGATATASATPVAGATPAANGTPTAIADWSTFKAQLGFTVFLPATLPAGTCLLDAFGSVHNAVYGSNFTLTYTLPDQTSLTIAQVPQRTQNTNFQCSVSQNSMSDAATPSATAQAKTMPLQLCTGVHATTNVTFSARWSASALKRFFQALQPDINWQPAQ